MVDSPVHSNTLASRSFAKPIRIKGDKMANKSGIHIKPENEGKFTATAKAAGKSVQEEAKSVIANPKASPKLKKRAVFAQNAKKWHHTGHDMAKMDKAKGAY